MCPGVTFQIKGVIETLPAECAQVPLGVAMTLHVAVQQPLQCESLGTDPTCKLGRISFRSDWRELFFRFRGWICHHRVFHSMTTINQLNRSIRWDSKLRKKHKTKLNTNLSIKSGINLFPPHTANTKYKHTHTRWEITWILISRLGRLLMSSSSWVVTPLLEQVDFFLDGDFILPPPPQLE